MPDREREYLSPLGRSYLGGLLQYAVPSTAFATPTVNGYRRYRPNSLAPDRATWCYDHRGVMIRVLGGPEDPATRMENRIGEPAANPYLYIASQIAAGLDGIEHGRDPGPPDADPYNADRPMLPKSLPEALDALEREPLFRAQFGEVFIDYLLKLKRNEAGRFEQWRRRPAFRGGRADRMGAERVLRFLLGGVYSSGVIPAEGRRIYPAPESRDPVLTELVIGATARHGNAVVTLFVFWPPRAMLGGVRHTSPVVTKHV